MPTNLVFHVKPKILVVDDQALPRHTLTQCLGNELDVVSANGVSTAYRALHNDRFDGALIDVRLGDGVGFEVLARIRILYPTCAAVMRSMYGEVIVARAAADAGFQERDYRFVQASELRRDVILDILSAERRSLPGPVPTALIRENLTRCFGCSPTGRAGFRSAEGFFSWVASTLTHGLSEASWEHELILDTLRGRSWKQILAGSSRTERDWLDTRRRLLGRLQIDKLNQLLTALGAAIDAHAVQPFWTRRAFADWAMDRLRIDPSSLVRPARVEVASLRLAGVPVEQVTTLTRLSTRTCQRWFRAMCDEAGVVEKSEPTVKLSLRALRKVAHSLDD